MTLSSMSCKFPLWTYTEKPTHKYCGKPVYRRSYCLEHYKLCHLNPKTTTIGNKKT